MEFKFSSHHINAEQFSAGVLTCLSGSRIEADGKKAAGRKADGQKAERTLDRTNSRPN